MWLIYISLENKEMGELGAAVARGGGGGGRVF